MAQMRRWVPGLLAVGLLWLAAAWFKTSPVEQDIGPRAASALQGLALDKTQLSLSGRDLTIAGNAFSEADRAKAAATADDVYGVRLVNNGTQLVAEAKPYLWSAAMADGKLTLSGNAPLPAVRAKLLEAAKSAAGGAAPTDQMAYARGAAPGFDAAALLALGQLSQLSDGKISISDGKISISGTAKDAAARDAIVAALGKLPQGFTLAENNIKVPPYSFNVAKDGAAHTVTLNGAVPDESSRKGLLDLAGRTFFSDKVVDNLKVAAGAPAGFTDAIKALFFQLSRLDTGSVTLSDKSLELKGDALYGRAAEQIKAAIASQLPQGFDVKTNLAVKAPMTAVAAPECQRLFGDLLGRGKILFDTGKASIDQTSTGLLDNLVAVSLRCPSSRIEVSGHTDATGNDDMNLDLSKRRAQSVVDYLVNAGFDASHLSAVGYGKTRPVASNDTEEGREQNRRIEFAVQ